MNFKKFLCMMIMLTCCIAVVAGLCSCKDDADNGDNKQGSAGNPFYVVYKDVKIELDKKAEDVLKKLGEAKYEDDLGDCGGIGVQTKYTYDDISVNTLKEKDGEVIHKISFINDIVSTPKGISIGSAESEVRAAYGEPTSAANGKLIYKSGDLELEFTIKDGTVGAVNYRRIR